MMMNFSFGHEFSVLGFSASTVTGCRFQVKAGVTRLTAFAGIPVDPDNPAEAWKKISAVTGRGKERPLYLCGPLPGAVCFPLQMAELSHRELAMAAAMELPRHLPKVEQDQTFQYLVRPGKNAGTVELLIFTVRRSAFNRIAAMVTQSNCRADEYVTPLFGVQDGDPPLELPEEEPGFYFSGAGWHPLPAPNSKNDWESVLRKEFQLPDTPDFQFERFLPALLTARVVSRSDFHAIAPGLRLLPSELHPRRYRNQLKITALLLFLLLLAGVWNGGAWQRNLSTRRQLRKVSLQLTNENRELARKFRSREKSAKELTRLLALHQGETDVVGQLADLSAALPSNVLVNSIRWSESGIELMLQSDSENVDINGALRKLPYWKISQLQQRRWGQNGVSNITLRLIPVTEVRK